MYHNIPPTCKTTLSVNGPIECPYVGLALLNHPAYNKGSAFSLAERYQFNLNGLLPSNTNTLGMFTFIFDLIVLILT